jgi:mono/diheme cytochrome c family protein
MQETYAVTEAISAPSSKESAALSKGKNLFQQNCQSCHSLDKDLTGPALRGFTQRGPWENKENIYAWIKNPSAFMANNDYTKNLKAQYGSVMPSFPGLTTAEIDEIVNYISAAPATGGK